MVARPSESERFQSSFPVLTEIDQNNTYGKQGSFVKTFLNIEDSIFIQSSFIERVNQKFTIKNY